MRLTNPVLLLILLLLILHYYQFFTTTDSLTNPVLIFHYYQASTCTNLPLLYQSSIHLPLLSVISLHISLLSQAPIPYLPRLLLFSHLAPRPPYPPLQSEWHPHDGHGFCCAQVTPTRGPTLAQTLTLALLP